MTILSLTWESSYLGKMVFILSQDLGLNMCHPRASKTTGGASGFVQRFLMNCLQLVLKIQNYESWTNRFLYGEYLVGITHLSLNQIDQKTLFKIAEKFSQNITVFIELT